MNRPAFLSTQSVLKGLPCLSSYWVGADRAELAERIAERRHQQAIPGDVFLSFDPATAATASLMVDHGHSLKKLSARLARRKAGL
jgi:hypothetical protein